MAPRMTRGHLLSTTAGLALALASGGLAGVARAADDEAQAKQIGAQVYNDLYSRNLIVGQSPYYSIVRSVGQKISQAAQPHWFSMNFVIIKGNQANAFSAPGGNVYVNQGLLRTADNVDELACVLGHETAHLVLGHVVNQLKQQQHVSALSSIAHMFVHSQGAQNTYNVANIGANYGFLNYTRTQEYQADQDGTMIAAKAGYDPWGTVWFLQEVEKLYGDAGYEQYVQQHPSTSDRIQRVESYLKGDPKKFGHWSPSLKVTSGLPASDANDMLELH
jgi:predicted Zn-dependent protease